MLSSEIGGREYRCLDDRLNNDFRRDTLALRMFPKIFIAVVNAKRRTEEDVDCLIQRRDAC